MLSTQYINLDMTPSGVLPVLYCSQYDIGRPLGMVVYNASEAVNLTAFTATIEATRSDGTAILAPVTTDGNVAAFVTTATMTNQADKYPAKLVLVDASGNRAASLAFIIAVTPKTMDENAEEIQEDASLFQQYTITAEALIAEIRTNLAAEVAARQAAINSEAASRSAADNTLQNRLNTETTARESADTALSNQISTEITARQAADATLSNSLSVEAATRGNKDADLQAQINQYVTPSTQQVDEVVNARVGVNGRTYTTLGEALRGQVTDINNDMNAYNAYDLLRDNSTYTSRTSGGVTFTWDATGEVCTATGTASGVAFTNLFVSTTSLMPGIVAGGTYIFTATSSSENLVLEVIIASETETIVDDSVWSGSKAITIPANAHHMTVRIRAFNQISNATIRGFAFLNTESNYSLSMTRAKVFATRADMIADRSLRIGQYAMTMGYYAEGDGGWALYRIASTRPADYHPTLQSGLYAVLIPNGEINAAAFGAIGDNDTVTKARYAIQAAIDYGLNLRFPVDIVIGGGITISNDLDGKRIVFDGDITYSGSVAALTVHNTKNVEVVGKNIVCTGVGPGILYLQDGTGSNARTLHNTNVRFLSINSGGFGVELQAHTWGILECCIHVDRIRTAGSGIFAHCLGEDNENHVSFIGQMRYEVQHIYSGQYAIRFEGLAESSTITGAFIDSISFESSANGIRLKGDCKLIKIYNIRILEADSFTNIIEANGDLRYIDITFTSPVRDDKIAVSSTYSRPTRPIHIGGGIISPTSFRFADYLEVSNAGRAYGGSTLFERLNGGDFTFKENDASYRCFTRLINNSGTTVTYSNVQTYFNPYGYDTLYITQNKSDGSIIKVLSGSRVIFNGEEMAEEGETSYMVKTFYNPSAGSVGYLTAKL